MVQHAVINLNPLPLSFTPLIPSPRSLPWIRTVCAFHNYWTRAHIQEITTCGNCSLTRKITAQIQFDVAVILTKVHSCVMPFWNQCNNFHISAWKPFNIGVPSAPQKLMGRPNSKHLQFWRSKHQYLDEQQLGQENLLDKGFSTLALSLPVKGVPNTLLSGKRKPKVVSLLNFIKTETIKVQAISMRWEF